MKLLIVDDQPGVTEGLCHGVNWAQLGFSQVQAVNSVREARAAMLNTVPDVMLCDIEMPEETGLELFKWVKKQGFATRCIFLTAHAKFSYAQEAMHLGAFDYIIQPAPYSEISQVTARAVKDVQASRDQKELTQMGRAFNEQAQAITAQAIRAFLSRQHNERDVKTLQGLGIFPRSDRDGYLVLIHILRWEPTADHWEKQLLAVALNNIAAETFAVHSELSPIASVDEHSYAMLLQNIAGEEMDLEGIMRQLMYISNVAQQYLRCSMAFYLDDKLPVPKMPDLWEKLLHMQGENVTLRSGVFRLKEAPRQPHIFRVPQIRTWNTLLKDGYPEAVKQEAMTLLDEMSARGEMNADSLRSFYQDFMQMIYFTVGGSEAIDMCIRTVVQPGDEVVIPEPCFVCYEPITTLSGGVPVHVACRQEDEFRLRPEALKAAITPRTKLLIMPFPNNPTGAVMEKEDLEAIADVLRDTNVLVLSDEIYAELNYGLRPHVSIATLPGMAERTIVVNGFSKSYAMTGWRLGYACGPAPIIKIMTKIHQSAIMSAPTTSQYAAITALKDCDGEIDRMRDEYNMRRRLVVKGFNAMGLTCFEPRGAFYAFPCIKSTGMTSQEFCTRLLEQKHVALVPGDAFGASGEGYCRVSYAYSVEHLTEAMKRIRAFLEENGIAMPQ